MLCESEEKERVGQGHFLKDELNSWILCIGKDKRGKVVLERKKVDHEFSSGNCRFGNCNSVTVS